MSNNVESIKSQDDPVKTLIRKYPRIIVLKAVFNLLDNEEKIDLESLENEVVKLLKN
ncbi:hypothetical protein X928_05000 [Petrotoga miotherma DSM 10691]|uniref:Uncharacterized protein n=1 Tax=Petrotoga miotherma DSM 10691 TaxID=1434326 RepID=A0A2K1PCW4_9BACT|nr:MULTISPECIES: hypothetical protein [Petrotoga]PNS00568.1 hypothetical protein X928_05000 [Petrotoga miotherma DSM 10691]